MNKSNKWIGIVSLLLLVCVLCGCSFNDVRIAESVTDDSNTREVIDETCCLLAKSSVSDS